MNILNQNKEDFKAWLQELPEQEFAVAGDQCNCWLAKWFESQGFYVWGVFPDDPRSRICDSYGYEVFLDDPECNDFNESDRVGLEDWACVFGTQIDYQYSRIMESDSVTRDQALTILQEIDNK